MRNPDERMVHCLEAIIKELRETNKQLKIANQVAVMSDLPFLCAPDIVKQRSTEIAKALDLA